MERVPGSAAAQMGKQNVVYTYGGISFSLKRDEILTHVTHGWMDLEDIALS